MEFIVTNNIAGVSQGIAIGTSINDLKRVSIYSFSNTKKKIIGWINPSGVVLTDEKTQQILAENKQAVNEFLKTKDILPIS
jgi:hypothetical protein